MKPVKFYGLFGLLLLSACSGLYWLSALHDQHLQLQTNLNTALSHPAANLDQTSETTLSSSNLLPGATETVAGEALRSAVKKWTNEAGVQVVRSRVDAAPPASGFQIISLSAELMGATADILRALTMLEQAPLLLYLQSVDIDRGTTIDQDTENRAQRANIRVQALRQTAQIVTDADTPITAIEPGAGSEGLPTGHRLFGIVPPGADVAAAPTSSGNAVNALPQRAPPDITLVGVVFHDDTGIARVLSAGAPQTVSVRIGDEIDGWTIEHIQPDAVVLFNGRDRFGISLDSRHDSRQRAEIANRALLQKLQQPADNGANLNASMRAVGTMRAIQERAAQAARANQ